MPGKYHANGTERSTDWTSVNWRKVNRQVRNLRQRIFRATQTGDWNKVRSLQKLMLRSYSNTLLSVRRVTQVNKGRNTAGVDKLVVKTPAARERLEIGRARVGKECRTQWWRESREQKR